MMTSQPVWRGGGVPGGGSAHMGHANWFSMLNPHDYFPDGPMPSQPTNYAAPPFPNEDIPTVVFKKPKTIIRHKNDENNFQQNVVTNAPHPENKIGALASAPPPPENRQGSIPDIIAESEYYSSIEPGSSNRSENTSNETPGSSENFSNRGYSIGSLYSSSSHLTAMDETIDSPDVGVDEFGDLTFRERLHDPDMYQRIEDSLMEQDLLNHSNLNASANLTSNIQTIPPPISRPELFPFNREYNPTEINNIAEQSETFHERIIRETRERRIGGRSERSYQPYDSDYRGLRLLPPSDLVIIPEVQAQADSIAQLLREAIDFGLQRPNTQSLTTTPNVSQRPSMATRQSSIDSSVTSSSSHLTSGSEYVPGSTPSSASSDRVKIRKRKR